MSSDLSQKTILITGGSTGIGKAAATALAKMGAHIVIVAHDPQRAAAAQTVIRSASTHPNKAVDVLLADLSSQQAIRELAAEITQKYPRIDILINNAGATSGRRRVTVDELEYTFALNHLAYFLLTHLLLDTIKNSTPARIVNVSSDAHNGSRINFDDLQGEKTYSPWGAYGQSKLANILFTVELARQLEGTGITVNCLHPGFVNSRFGRDGDINRFSTAMLAVMARLFALTPEQGADTVVYLASSPDVANITGKYFVARKEKTPSKEATDPETAEQLWQVSEVLTGLAEAPMDEDDEELEMEEPS